MPARRAFLMGLVMPPRNHQIPDVWDPSERICKNGNRIPLMKKRVGEQQQ